MKRFMYLFKSSLHIRIMQIPQNHLAWPYKTHPHVISAITAYFLLHHNTWENIYKWYTTLHEWCYINTIWDRAATLLIPAWCFHKVWMYHVKPSQQHKLWFLDKTIRFSSLLYSSPQSSLCQEIWSFAVQSVI